MSDSHLEDWSARIHDWAKARGLLADTHPRDQILKLVEELGELSIAIQKDDLLAAQDAIGDCCVVLCVIADQLSLSFAHCLEAAWDEIKDRKGKTVDGVFVKENL